MIEYLRINDNIYHCCNHVCFTDISQHVLFEFTGLLYFVHEWLNKIFQWTNKIVFVQIFQLLTNKALINRIESEMKQHVLLYTW